MDAQDVNQGNNNNNDDGGGIRIPERLLRREQARQEDAERRREAKEKQSVTEENSEFFILAFNRDREAVEELMAACSGSDRAADTQTLDRAAAQTQQLQKFLNDSVMFLAQYELRQAQASLQRLQTSLAEKRDEVLPKKKFAFRSRTRATEPVPDAVGPPPPGPATAPDGVKVDVTPHAEQCGFSNMAAAVLTKTSEEIDKQDVLLSHLTDCRVRLYGSPCTVHIKHVRGCEILCGPVSGSVFVDHCSDSTLAVACQQLRTHHTTATRVYLHVTSRAIVEDCNGVGFAPFTWSYPTLDRDFEASGLDRARNNWDQVDDFNWLAAGTPSPNWTVIAEEDRRTNWDL